jgi:DNA-binding transcriptional LysR family regulator
MIDPRLRVLQLVAEHGTVTAAAEALHYTPSAVSYQLRQLSEQLGVDLVVPQGRRVRLTPAAHTLLRHGEQLQAQWERARADLAALGDEPHGTFAMCGFSTAATYLLPRTAASLRDRYPLLTVRLIEAEPARCFALLLAGDADLALVVITSDTPSPSDERFHQEPLLDDPLDLVTHEGHPLAARDRVTLADAASEPWIMGSPGTTYHQLVMTACMAAGFGPDVAHYADEWDTGMALVAHGFGVVLVPRLARLNSDWPVARIPLHGEPAPARRILAATRAGSEGNPTIVGALDAISRIAVGARPQPPDPLA